MNETPASPGDVIHIEKIAPDGQPVITYEGWLLADADPVLVLARWESPDLPLPYVTFAYGDLLLEAYYRQRPYNIFALFDGGEASPDIDWGEIIAGRSDLPRHLSTLEPLCQRIQAACPLKGHYINFTRLLRYDSAQRTLTWRDLALDIWAPANGQPLLLDEEEYRALNLAQSEPELARAIEQARRTLLHQARTHTRLFGRRKS